MYKGLEYLILRGCGYAKLVREEFIKSEGFTLYEDTVETLRYFKEMGYSNVILSNHIPDLPSIVQQLGLSEYLVDCISSANVGYEKPNVKIHEYALKKHNYPKEVCMVGDSITSDVRGPEALGIKGVLVRRKREDAVLYYSEDLLGLREIIK